MPQLNEPFIKPAIQRKLNVGKPGDKYEVEADDMANKVVDKIGEQNTIQKTEGNEEELQQKPLAASVTPLAQRKESTEEDQVQSKCDECEKEEPVQKQEDEEPIQKMNREEEQVQKMDKEEEPIQKVEDEKELQAKSNVPNTSATIASRLKKSKGRGSKLSAEARNEMESGFGADFNNVNIHTDSGAVQMNKELRAQAFTHGNDVYFNQGKYNPNSREGKHLLAHELTHVIQQDSFIRKKDNSSNESSKPKNPLVGLKRGDGLIYGTWDLRPRVKLLQQKLNEKTGSRLKIDGMFGKNTGKILRTYKATMDSEITEDLTVSLHEEENNQSQPTGFENIADGSEIVDQKTADSLMGAKAQQETPILNNSVMFVLEPPPPFCQGDALVCWAAAAASWLNATKILPGATRNSLMIRFGHCMCDDGSLPEQFVPQVYGELGIDLSDVTTFDYEFLRSHLKAHGHLILLLGGAIGHAVVVYGVGVSDTGAPDENFYSIFDPIDCLYHNLRFGSQTVQQIGIKTQPGPRAVCANVAHICGED